MVWFLSAKVLSCVWQKNNILFMPLTCCIWKNTFLLTSERHQNKSVWKNCPDRKWLIFVILISTNLIVNLFLCSRKKPFVEKQSKQSLKLLKITLPSELEKPENLRKWSQKLENSPPNLLTVGEDLLRTFCK